MSRLIILFALLPAPLYAEPTTIIHIMNYHYVTPEVFAADLKDQDSTITQEQIDKQYDELIKGVESIQKVQVKRLRRMIKKYMLKGVYIEGLTEKNHRETIETIESMKKYEKEDPSNEVFEFLYWQDKLVLGAAGQLAAKGELETLYVTEAFEAANPVRDGKIVFYTGADERREDAIVRNLLKGNGFVVIVLGRDQNLSANLKRLAKGVKYKRIGFTDIKSGQGLNSIPRIKIRKVGE